MLSLGDVPKNSCSGTSEAATGVVLLKKMYVKIWQNSQENTCARVSFLIKWQASSFAFHIETNYLFCRAK